MNTSVMQAENEQSADMQNFKDYRDPKPRSRKRKMGKVSGIPKSETSIAHFKSMRKNSLLGYRQKLRRVLYSDHPHYPQLKSTNLSSEELALATQRENFIKREITPILEEVPISAFLKPNSEYRAKAYKNKVASLKNIVKRLQAMGVTKPEMIQNKLPEEFMQLFSEVQI